MPSDKQIAANRRNAQKSTGPVTPAGKARSAMNALKTGLHAKSLVLPTEKRADFELLTAEYYDQFRPDTAELRDLLDEFITLVWQLRRLGVTEVQLYKHEQDEFWNPDQVNHPQGKIAAQSYRAFAALQRRLDSTRRSRDRVRESIRLLRSNEDATVSERDTSQPALALSKPPAPAPSPASTCPQNGFVPSPAPEPGGAQPSRPVHPVKGAELPAQAPVEQPSRPVHQSKDEEPDQAA